MRVNYSGLFFSQQSFAKGLGRSIDVAGGFDEYNSCPTPDEADRAALASDWYAAGADLHRQIRFNCRRNLQGTR